jgi:hypothetical protein
MACSSGRKRHIGHIDACVPSDQPLWDHVGGCFSVVQALRVETKARTT